MNNILEDLEQASYEHEAIKPLMEKLERALNGDKTINFRELQQELEQYINSDNISMFEDLKEDLMQINEKLTQMIETTPEYTTENRISTDENIESETTLDEIEVPVTDILSDLPSEQDMTHIEDEPTLQFSSIEDVMDSITRHKNNTEEALNIVISAPLDAPYTRNVLINGESFHLGDIEEFDQKNILDIYRNVSEKYNLEVLTNQTEDIELHNRFMASDGPHTMVLLDLPHETLENVYREVTMHPVKPDTVTGLEQKPVEEAKQMVKTNKPTNNSMGFANGLSLGMGIGIAIVLIIVAMMYFGVLKP